MAGSVYATVTLENKSGAPRDRIVNGFAFICPSGPTSTEYNAIATGLEAFYNSAPTGGTFAIGKYMGGQLSRSIKPVVRCYDITGKEAGGPLNPMGSPAQVQDFLGTLTVPISSNNLPAEVAIAITLQAAYGTDVEFGGGTRPRARDRGRVYIGPLTNGVFATDGTTGQVTVDPVVQDNFARAAKDLGLMAGGPVLAVWSRANASLKNVSNVWVDNDFDVQRRRSARATSRLVLAS